MGMSEMIWVELHENKASRATVKHNSMVSFRDNLVSGLHF